jgi:murein DD-endopeptidase MepM/ murein hydrolase activator NlpD
MGQIVDQRETIGRILAANRSLYFEIRFGGKKQSPRSYLPPIDLPE